MIENDSTTKREETLTVQIGNHRVWKWQLNLKPGDYVAQFFHQGDDFDTIVRYLRILDVKSGNDDHQGLRYSVGELDEMSDGLEPIDEVNPWDCHFPLDSEDVSNLADIQFPRDPEGFVSAMQMILMDMRTKQLVSMAVEEFTAFKISLRPTTEGEGEDGTKPRQATHDEMVRDGLAMKAGLLEMCKNLDKKES